MTPALRLMVTAGFVLLASPFAQAEIDKVAQSAIEKSCLDRVKLNPVKPKNAKNLCACIAKSHAEGASKEKDSNEGQRQLKWYVSYYTEKDQKKLEKMMEKEEALTDLDLSVVEDCQRTAK